MRFSRQRNGRARTRVLFATDLHGSEAVFRKFLNAVGVYEATIAILGGDLTGKRIVPIVEDAEGVFTTEFNGSELRMTTGEELAAARRRIQDAGQYPITVSPQHYQSLLVDDAAVHEEFLDACVGQVRDWMERAAEPGL